MRSQSLWSVATFVCFSSFAHAGLIEICKDSTPVGALSGPFSFTIAGQNGTFTVPVGACTPVFELPDGLAIITEDPQSGVEFFSVATFPDERLVSFDPLTSSATVLIVPGDISFETIVTFTNTPANTSIPEPGTAWLLGAGLALWFLRRSLTKRGGGAFLHTLTRGKLFGQG